MVLCDDKKTTKDELMMLAKQIFKEYILEGADFHLEENEIVKGLRAGYNTKADVVMM